VPSKSPAQHRLMEAAAHTPGGYDGVPQSVGKEFVAADSSPEYEVGVNELTIAKQIRDNLLSSPQQYENLWLFDVRVTGTGTSYRQALDEYVYRPPENFLTDEFVERCNGLPLIFEHPDDSMLTTEEYRNRAIGTIVLPYIQGDEVRGIAKVWDIDAAKLMLNTHISTSPAVVFRDAGSTETIELSDGKTVLVEGKPSLLDHLAICEEGVWDKGGTPNGVNIQEDLQVDHEESAPAWADKLGKRFDSLEARLDSVEKGRKDSKEEKEEKEDKEEKKADSVFDDSAEEKDEKEGKKVEKEEESEEEKADSADSEEKEVEKEEKKEEKAEKKDSAERKDSQSARENAELKAHIARLEARFNTVTKPLSYADREALSAAQTRADGVGQLLGKKVTAPLAGESPIDYRKRLANGFKGYSDSMKKVDVAGLDGSAFDLIEEKIYADATAAALSPAHAPEGRLIPVVTREMGRDVTRFHGDMDGWLNSFKSPGVVGKFVRPQGNK
jgi:hypothetical protein